MLHFQCECKDPNYKPKSTTTLTTTTAKPTTTTTRPACGYPNYRGDTNCDDSNNRKSCNWDDGDCCGTSVKKSFCTKVNLFILLGNFRNLTTAVRTVTSIALDA